MGDIRLLDCTLRDGGYINDWKFGEKAIEETVAKMSRSGVDILELGFLKDEPYKKSRTVFNSMKQISALIRPKNPAVRYAAMIEVVNPLPLDRLEERDEDSVEIIRVIVWKRLLKEGYEYCKGVVGKGYRLCVQPARVDQYSYDEFVEMIELFNTLDPLAVYVVDSFGTQTKETLLPYLRLADEHLKPGVAVGYHGHNNMMQALETAEMFVNTPIERDMIIDASIYGMGRGAGNLNGELFAKYMNEKLGKNYQIEPMLELYDKYLKPVYEKCPWGYSLPYFLTAKHKCNPNYGSYYGQELKIDSADINGTLKTLSDEDKIIFTKDKAETYLKAYLKKKMNLAVIIPTCNRAQIIDDYLFHSAENFRHYGIDIIVYDSSDNDETEAVVQNFRIDGYSNVIYKRYVENLKEDHVLNDIKYKLNYVSYKVISALKEYCKKYDYLWVIRDRHIITINKCYDDLLKYTQEKFDCIIVENASRHDNEKFEKVYHAPKDAVEIFKNYAPWMTTLGSLILSSKIAQTLINNYPVDDTNDAFWLNITPFYYFAENEVKVASYAGAVYQCSQVGNDHPQLNDSFWNKSGGAIRTDAYCWHHDIDKLPSLYDPAKPDVLKFKGYDIHPFFVNTLLSYRASGSLSIKVIRQYKSDLPYVCDTSLKKFYVAALVPKSIAGYLVSHPYSKFYKTVKAFYDLNFGVEEEICK